MSTNPVPSPGAGIDSQIALARATPVVWRNSKLLCWAVALMGLVAAFLGVCLLIVGLTVIFPLSHITMSRAVNGALWMLGAIFVGGQCPQFWALGRAMTHYQVLLDERGVTFNLGTKTKPSDLFLRWDQIGSIQYRRAGNSKQFWIEGNDAGKAVWSYYTFFRPGKVAQLIADRTGLPIQKTG